LGGKRGLSLVFSWDLKERKIYGRKA